MKYYNVGGGGGEYRLRVKKQQKKTLKMTSYYARLMTLFFIDFYLLDYKFIVYLLRCNDGYKVDININAFN